MSSKRPMIETFERKRIDPHRLYGVVVAESAELLLIHQVDDFQCDGYAIVRQRDVSSRTSGKSNAYCERVMRREGLWLPVPRWVRSLPLEDWERLLRALIGRVAIVENERQDDYCIGPVLGLEQRRVWIHYFDSCGKLGEVDRFRLNRLTRVKIATRYSDVHGRHLTPPWP